MRGSSITEKCRSISQSSMLDRSASSKGPSKRSGMPTKRSKIISCSLKVSRMLLTRCQSSYRVNSFRHFNRGGVSFSQGNNLRKRPKSNFPHVVLQEFERNLSARGLLPAHTFLVSETSHFRLRERQAGNSAPKRREHSPRKADV